MHADDLADVAPLPFPLQAVATGPVTRAALEQGRPELAVVLAGQGAPLARTLGAADLVAALVEETEETLSRLGRG
jgi:nitronate monooxygenase